jgi:hypothetical protein
MRSKRKRKENGCIACKAQHASKSCLLFPSFCLVPHDFNELTSFSCLPGDKEDKRITHQKRKKKSGSHHGFFCR